MGRVCSTKGCSKPYHARGLCNAHAKKRARKLDPDMDKRYEKTPKGFLMRLYRNMQSRITGVQKKKYHLYKGKTLLSREDFYSWAGNHSVFIELYNLYVASGYDIKLAPSVDRINPDKGYELSNMEWITHSENSRRSSVTRRRLEV
jgi:hypothetical protein